jgi:DNA-binding transcriptional MerR regulator
MVDELLTTNDAARILNRSAESVRNYERRGLLTAQRTPNGQRLFRRGDVEAMAKQMAWHGENGK